MQQYVDAATEEVWRATGDKGRSRCAHATKTPCGQIRVRSGAGCRRGHVLARTNHTPAGGGGHRGRASQDARDGGGASLASTTRTRTRAHNMTPQRWHPSHLRRGEVDVQRRGNGGVGGVGGGGGGAPAPMSREQAVEQRDWSTRPAAAARARRAPGRCASTQHGRGRGADGGARIPSHPPPPSRVRWTRPGCCRHGRRGRADVASS